MRGRDYDLGFKTLSSIPHSPILSPFSFLSPFLQQVLSKYLLIVMSCSRYWCLAKHPDELD